METNQGRLATNSPSRGRSVGGIKFDRPARVTKEMVTAARIAVRKANEEAKKARLRGNRTRT